MSFSDKLEKTWRFLVV